MKIIRKGVGPVAFSEHGSLATQFCLLWQPFISDAMVQTMRRREQNESHICVNGDGVYSPLPFNYYHRYYERSVFYNFSCPPNTLVTSLNRTLQHFAFSGMETFTAMQPIRIAFTAYDIHGVAQKHGGDHFVVRVHKSAEHSNRMKQAFRVIHLLLPDAARYTLWILHKFGCFDAMMNDRGHINANMSWLGTFWAPSL